MDESGRLLTVPEVAERLRVDPETVRRWLRSGRLAGYQPGGEKAGWRVTESALQAYVEERYGKQGRGGHDGDEG